MKTSLFLFVIVLGIILSSGCVFNDHAADIGMQLKETREKFVGGTALLLPLTVENRLAYQTTLYSFRTPIKNEGGFHTNTLNAYVDGTLLLLDVAQLTTQGENYLANNPAGPPDCRKTSPMGNALSTFEKIVEKVTEANQLFREVENDSLVANAVGVEYVQSAIQTTHEMILAHGARVTQIQTYCGITS